jgi:acetoacetyl-CoA synthetase
VSRIKKDIEERYSPRHVPKDIFEVAALPYTANGKRCEINVKRILYGMDSAVGGSVVSPESLEGYRKYYSLPTHVIRHRTEIKL